MRTIRVNYAVSGRDESEVLSIPTTAGVLECIANYLTNIGLGIWALESWEVVL